MADVGTGSTRRRRRQHRLSELANTYVSKRTAEDAISPDSPRAVRSVLRRFIGPTASGQPRA